MAATFSYPSRPDPPDLLTTHPDMDPEFVATYAAGVNATMTSAERMYALWQATRQVIATGVPGALVECGVWRGGSSMVMAHAMLTMGVSDRELWLYDTFEGILLRRRPTRLSGGVGAVRRRAGRAHDPRSGTE